MKYWLASVLLRILGLLPLPLAHALAVPLGRLWRFLPWREHPVIHTNLSLCFPDQTAAWRERLHRQHLVEMARLALEAGVVWYGSLRRINRLVRRHQGWQAVEQAAERGKGILLVGAHYGNWEILPLWISARVPVSALYRAPASEALDRTITASRQRFGAELIASGSPAMRRMLARLKRGGLIGLLADQQPKQGEGVFVPFFGVPALTMTLVNRLARHTGCAVFFASCRRLPRGRGWELSFTSAPEIVSGNDPCEAMRAFHGWLEQRVGETPAQYLWNYKRFSLRPGGAESPYPPRKRRRRRT